MSTAASPSALKVDQATHRRLQRLAKARKRTVNSVAREALDVYLAREEARDQFDRDAQAAWQHYQETGLHATADDVKAWVASWGTEQELPMPACRS